MADATCDRLLEIAQTIDLNQEGALVTIDVVFLAHVHNNLADFPPIFEKEVHTPDQYLMRYTYYNVAQCSLSICSQQHVYNARILLIVNLGGLVTKTKSILMYKVELYVRGYLVLLQKLRSMAISQGNKPLRNLLKLMGNGIYSKFNRSNMKHLVVKQIATIEEYEKTIQSQRFKSVQFHKRNCLTTQRQRYVRCNALLIVATHILGSSKASLYKYYCFKTSFYPPNSARSITRNQIMLHRYRLPCSIHTSTRSRLYTNNEIRNSRALRFQ